jgi:hypothetical protein
MFVKVELEDEWSLVMSERERAMQNQRDLVEVRVALQQLEAQHATCVAQLQQLRAEKLREDAGGVEQAALLREQLVENQSALQQMHALGLQVDILTAQVSFFQIRRLYFRSISIAFASCSSMK